MEKPGTENEIFYLLMKDYTPVNKEFLYNSGGAQLKVLEQPKRLWFNNILYYLSLGLYDRRGYSYKVKLVNN